MIVIPINVSAPPSKSSGLVVAVRMRETLDRKPPPSAESISRGEALVPT